MKEHNEIIMRGGMIMSEKKLSQEELLRRIDELLSVLNMISRDLTDITKTLKETGVPAPAPAVAPSEARTIESVQTWFPKNLEAMLTFEDVEDYIMIKPRQYLGSENFAKIASIIRDNGGEYISAGKESHFRVPK
jgi:hypothetical protein